MLAVLNQVATMEKQLDAAVKELAAMRQELKTAQEQNHPVKHALQKTVIAMQGQVLDLRDKLAELKQHVVDGCKNAVAAFRENGISALDNVARFFKIKPLLETMRDSLNESIKWDDKAISKIETISAEYHQAGRHLKNIGRAMLGKEAIQEAKPPGMLTKTILAPYRAERSCLSAMKKTLNPLSAVLPGWRPERNRQLKKPYRNTANRRHRIKRTRPPRNGPAPPMRSVSLLRAMLARSPPVCVIAVCGRKGGFSCRKI